MSDEPLLFNPEDFQSIQLYIGLSNLTSRTELSEHAGVEMMSFDDRTALLHLPAKFCSSGHQLKIKIRALPPGQDMIEFEATAKVHEFKHLNDDEDEIAITLVQFLEDEWKAIQGLYAKRQDDISAFFESVKGY